MVDIGIFIVVLQFFAAMATVEGEDRVLLQGLFFVSVFNCFIGCVGGIFVAVGLLDDRDFSTDDGVDGTVELLQSGWC